jgi:hypothetical protein
MKWLFLIITLLFGNLVEAQVTSPRNATAAAMLSTTTKTVNFRVSWVDASNVDSTMVAVFLSSDTLPLIFRRSVSPDTISFNIPDDTTTYRFQLISVRRGLVSNPANVNFYFNADSYYKVTRLHVKPDSVVVKDTTVAARTVQFCAFLEYNDGSIVMRDRDRTIPECLTEYEKFPLALRKSTGARLRNANTVCLNWQAVCGGTIQNETCSL